MYLRNSLVYLNIIYFLDCLNLVKDEIAEFLEEASGFIKDYEERLLKPAGSSYWRVLKTRLLERMFRIDLIINRYDAKCIELCT